MKSKTIFLIITCWILLCLFCGFITDASAQTGNIIGNVGFSSAGLGSHAGASAGFDADIGKDKLELINRLNFDFADKTTGPGYSFSERLIVRYGARWKFGGGLGINHVQADFGSRSTVSALGHVAYDYRHERYRFVPYVTARWSADDHATKGIEGGFELYETMGRLIFKQAAGVEALRFHDFGATAIRTQSYGFIRVGIGVTF